MGLVEGVVVRHGVSVPVAIIVVLLALAASLAAFSRGELAPKAAPAPPLPNAPEMKDADRADIAKGLSPLGVAVVMPPLGHDRFQGLRVAAVSPNSPGAKAGLQPGDLIVSFSGVKIENQYTLMAALEHTDPEKEYEVVIERAGERQTLKVAGVKPLEPEARVR